MAHGPPIVLAVPSDTPLWSQRTQLDGSDFILSFDYSGREDRFYLSIADSAGVAIVSGIKLVTNWPLLGKVSDTRRPKGELLAFDPLDGVEGAVYGPPGFRDLGPGRRVKLLYFPLAVSVNTTSAPAGGI